MRVPLIFHTLVVCFRKVKENLVQPPQFLVILFTQRRAAVSAWHQQFGVSNRVTAGSWIKMVYTPHMYANLSQKLFFYNAFKIGLMCLHW